MSPLRLAGERLGSCAAEAMALQAAPTECPWTEDVCARGRERRGRKCGACMLMG